MALLTSDMVLDKFLDRLEAGTAIMKMASGQFSKTWGSGPAKGRQVAIRLPIYVTGRRGEATSMQTVDERMTLLSIPDAFGADVELTDSDLSLNITDFDPQFIQPCVERVASDVANEACRQVFFGTHNFVGTPGVAPTTLDTYDDANRLLTQGGCPLGTGVRAVLVDALMDQKARAAGRSLFNSSPEIKRQYEEGTMGLFGGDKWNLEQHLYTHTVGLCAGSTPLANAVADQTGASIITDGWAISTKVLNAGDKVSFDASYMVHPLTKRVFGDLVSFTVATDVTSDGSGNATIPIVAPYGNGIEITGPYQNASAGVANNAPIYVWGKTGSTDLGTISGKNTTCGILMHKSALVYASPDLELPKDVDQPSGTARSERMSLGIRMWRASNIDSGKRGTRFDILCGFLVPQPQRACIIASK